MSTTLDTLIKIGTFAARPAASSAGRLYFASDTGVLYRDNGSGWDLYSAGAVSKGAFGSRPAAGTAGRLYLPTDAFGIYEDDGTAWNPYGPIFPFTNPSAPTWAWLNQAGASIVSGKSGEFLSTPRESAGAVFHARTAATGAVPYTCTAYLAPMIYQESNSTYGILLYDSVSGHIIAFRVTLSASTTPLLGVDTYTSTALAGHVVILNSQVAELPRWFQIQDDATHRTYRLSADGQNWTQFYQEATVTFITPTDAGFFVFGPSSTSANVPASVTLMSWAKT